MHRKAIIIFILALLTVPAYVQAEPLSAPADKYEQYIERLRHYQHQVLTRELDLSRDEANKFFPVYDKMCEELEQVGRETKVLEQRTLNNPNASATECENTARALFEQKKTESEIEMRYFEQFKNLLTPRQLVKLKSAEETFRKEVMTHFAKHRKRNTPARSK